MNITFKISLIILICAASGLEDEDDVEIVFLPVQNSSNENEIPLRFTVFGQAIDLLLKRNDKLLSPHFQFWRHSDSSSLEEVPELSSPTSCHYLHRDNSKSAAISFCEERKTHGIIFLENMALEITPVNNERAWPYNRIYGRSSFLQEPHIFKRSYATLSRSSFEFSNNIPIEKDISFRDAIRNSLTMELAVFFDEPGYRIFSPFFERDIKLRDMLLAYINGVQAAYHHPSLGVQINIVLVRLEIMQRQPIDLPHFNGERSGLLNSFCRYSKNHNPSDDSHPDHWDIGLYVSGLDFHAIENGRKNSVTMGLATVGGICLADYSCVIAEFGVTNNFGKPYPSAGFTSIYIAAHEIGHNLGMHHDSTQNSCPKNGFIMSPSRGTVDGETNWSPCSQKVAMRLSQTKPCLLDDSSTIDDSLNHSRYDDLPGREWHAKKQCELFLRDQDAVVASLYNACQSLQCTSPHKSGYYLAGPALEGTSCAEGRECRGGQCLPVLDIPSETGDVPSKEGGWSNWKAESCKSGCIQGSQGFRTRRRSCDNPPPTNNENCKGLSFDVQLCSDEKLCKKKRKSVSEFATEKCSLFSEKLPELDGRGSGLQAPHELERPWMACAIFCRRKDIASYYTPRIELNDIGLDPYFPDGTWCHREEGQDYFCREHHCLSENFRFGKILPADMKSNYMNLGPQNAYPGERKLPDELIRYLSLGLDGKPLLKKLPPSIFTPPDADWTDQDYVELPESIDKKSLTNYEESLLDLKSIFFA